MSLNQKVPSRLSGLDWTFEVSLTHGFQKRWGGLTGLNHASDRKQCVQASATYGAGRLGEWLQARLMARITGELDWYVSAGR